MSDLRTTEKATDVSPIEILNPCDAGIRLDACENDCTDFFSCCNATCNCAGYGPCIIWEC